MGEGMEFPLGMLSAPAPNEDQNSRKTAQKTSNIFCPERKMFHHSVNPIIGQLKQDPRQQCGYGPGESANNDRNPAQVMPAETPGKSPAPKDDEQAEKQF